MTEQLFDERPITWMVNSFGGINARDPDQELIRRSFRFDPNSLSWQQLRPIDLPAMQNMDFFGRGLGPRLGSSLYAASFLDAGDSIIEIETFRQAVSGARTTMMITAKTIYNDVGETGTFTKLKDSDGVNDFAWNEDITKCTTAEADGHFVIFPDGDNHKQIYRTGTQVDDQFNAAGTNTTTVDSNSASGQKVLNVAVTTSFSVGDRVIIDEDSAGDGEETGYVASIQAGVSITLVSNLTILHLGASADIVKVQNRWSETYTRPGNAAASNPTIEGNFKTGTWIGASINDRFLYTDGSGLIEITPRAYSDDGIYDLTSEEYGFFAAIGEVKALIPFTPRSGDQNIDTIYIMTSNGPQIATGFNPEYDTLNSPNTNEVIASHRAFFKANNWLVYLSDSMNIIAMNGPYQIDLGERFHNKETNDGPLDIDVITPEKVIGHYNSKTRKGYFWLTTGTPAQERLNDMAVVIDFRLGEPTLRDSRDVYEQRVRLMTWTITEPDDNDWFVAAAKLTNYSIAATADGALYQLENGNWDLDTLVIQDSFDLPDFASFDEMQDESWLSVYMRSLNNGDWDVTTAIIYNKSGQELQTFAMNQFGDTAAYGTARYDIHPYSYPGVVNNDGDLNEYQQSAQIRCYMQQGGKDYVITGLGLRYLPGQLERRT